MNINDYLISQTRTHWGRLLKDWMPPLPANFTLWLVNCLGDVFVVSANGAVLWLDVGSGRFTEAAGSCDEFARLLDTGDYANQWLRIRLVDACRQAGMRLQPHECYGFKIPPTLGGQYEVANLRPTNLLVHYSYQAYICKQTDVYWIPPQ